MGPAMVKPNKLRKADTNKATMDQLHLFADGGSFVMLTAAVSAFIANLDSDSLVS